MVQTTAYAISYTGNGTTTAFSFPYSYASSAHLVVTVDAVTKTLGTDYTVSDAGPASTCTVTFTTAPAASTVVLITRVTALTQLVDYVDNDNFPAETHEKAIDKLTLAIQELNGDVDGLDTANGGIYYTTASTPNGNVTATRPALCYDANGSMWVKTDSGSSTTGWLQIIGF